MKQFLFVAFALCLVAVQASSVEQPAQDDEVIDLPFNQMPYIAEFLHLGDSWKCVKAYKKAGQLISEKIRPHLGEIEHCFGHNAIGDDGRYSIESILDFLTNVLVEKQQCINKKFLGTVKDLVEYHRTIQKLLC